MTRCVTAFAIASLLATGGTAASELVPGSGYSIQLARFSGTLYYTVERDGYRVVTTLASGVEQQPIRFISTLAPGQRMVISVPQAIGQPSVDFEILRKGETLLLSDLVPTADLVEEASTLWELDP